MRTIEEQLVLWYTDSLYDDLEAAVDKLVLKYNDYLDRTSCNELKDQCMVHIPINDELKDRPITAVVKGLNAAYLKINDHTVGDYRYFLNCLFIKEVTIHLLTDPGMKVTRQIVQNKFKEKAGGDPQAAAEALIDLYTERIKSMNAEELVKECDQYSVVYR